ncbi:MAG TPA: decaprenyl-phosphate phosphoribosyltransferase [Thermomicrobiales bacterium]|nr:decaprenyl-phosphate phosphoribosyltransferase [Thermomicrobiales bacterium]
MPALLRAMRPLQWIKNGLVVAPLLFDRRLFDLDRVILSFGAIIAFCFVASGMYLINDVRDAEGDRHHPRKRFRPIASGDISPLVAVATAIILLVASLTISLAVRPGFTAVIGGYALLMVAYSLGLKQMVILDVFAISAGFVLRAVGGAVAIDVPISPWLYVCTMLASLLIGFGKRRHELALLGQQAVDHRANLQAYSVPLLDQFIGIVAASTVMAYALYTFDAATVPDNQSMMLTLPFVIYGIFRYLYLIYRRDLGGSPESLIFEDRPLLASVIGWAAASAAILYLWS